MKFFLDNCIAPVFAKVLNILAERQGYPIFHLRDRFSPDTKDPEWIRALAEEGEWIIVSGDPRISRGKAERQAWQESQLTAFFFGDGWTSRSYWKQAEDIVHCQGRPVSELDHQEDSNRRALPL